jgi:hypothetical protein
MIRQTFFCCLALMAYGCASDQDSEPTSQMDAAVSELDMGTTSTPELDRGMASTPELDRGMASTPELDRGIASTPDGAAPVEEDDCSRYCQYLEMCGQCLYDEQAECLDQDGCAAVCRQEVPPPTVACIAGLSECSEAEFQSCYDANIGDDDCARTCRFLTDCDECFVDDDGECLSLASCAAVCRMSTPPPTAQCIAQLTECSGITPCFDE